ncbi:MAG: HWE histidine kinase domain-containing protein [Xanthobacteraceae bacterium]
MDTDRLALHGQLSNSGVRDAVRSRLHWWRSVWPWGLSPGSAGALVFAVVCVGAATAVHCAIGLVRPSSVVFAPYCAATLVAALLGGGVAGALAMILGGVVAYWLFAPAPWTLAPFALANIDNWLLYASSSALILWVAVSYRGLLQQLREEQQKRQLLNQELAHRLGNMLASIQTILNQSLVHEKELREKIGARLAALAATNDLLSRCDWQSASLQDILIGELRPYDSTRVSWCGDEVRCSSQTAMLLALVIHELTTNAAKYGALSKPDGRIEIQWRHTDGRLTLQWLESVDLPPAPPTRKGFGSKLLESAIKRLDGEVETTFAPSGLRCRICAVLPQAPRAAEAP